MFHRIRTTMTAATITAIVAGGGAAMAQSDSRYERDRYRYDDYGSRQEYDQRYDTRAQSQSSTQRSSGYVDLFEIAPQTPRATRSSRDVYGYDDPAYTSPSGRTAAQQPTPYRGHTVTGEVRKLDMVNHDNVQHRHLTVQTTDGQNINIDLGPTSQLGGLNLERGERVRIMGQYRTVDGRDEFMADRIQADDEQRLLIERELKHQWVTGNVVGSTRTGFTLTTDDDRRILVDLGPAAQQVDLARGQRIQALGTLAEFGDQPVLIATQLRSLHTNQFTQPQTQQQPQRQVEDEEDEDDEWRNFGKSILDDIFK